MRIQIRRRGVTADCEPSILQHLEVRTTGEKQPITHQALAELPRQGTILLADAGKANLNHFQRFTGLKEVSFLITEFRLDDETTEAFDSAGLEVART